MDRQQQANELANDIYKRCPDLASSGCGGWECVSCLTNGLYAQGYRKQSEVVKVFADMLLKAFPRSDKDNHEPVISFDLYREMIDTISTKILEEKT